METIIKFLSSPSYPSLFFIGLGLWLYVGMRQFNRRGLGGLQHFRNYFMGLLILFSEQLLKWVGIALMCWGLWGWVFR